MAAFVLHTAVPFLLTVEGLHLVNDAYEGQVPPGQATRSDIVGAALHAVLCSILVGLVLW